MSTIRCITNNPMMLDRGFSALEYHDTDVLGLFNLILPEVAAGFRLLSHPLSGSIRPDITPYKTVLLSGKAGQVDEFSVQLINKAVRYAESLYQLREVPLFKRCTEQMRKDFQLIDMCLIERALEVSQLPR